MDETSNDELAHAIYKIPIEDMCPILDSGKGVAVQFITDHMYQMMFTYEKWHQYVEWVNRRNGEIKPMIMAIGTLGEPRKKSWVHEDCRKSIEGRRPEMPTSVVDQ